MVHGYKVFDPNWMCRNKKYTCPGEFKEDVELELCKSGMHFCEKAIDCFNYYTFNPNNHVAEVCACGAIVGDGDKKCTDKLQIIKEISWDEVLKIVNFGAHCTGIGNIGKNNTGDYNIGERNTGKYNGGKCNTGAFNIGDRNTGCHNIGLYNTGEYNVGNWNAGNYNIGNRNAGDWNAVNFSSGCFNTTITPMWMFNKLSDWTYYDWFNSTAKGVMERVYAGNTGTKWVDENFMTGEEKTLHPEYKVIGGYIRIIKNGNNVQEVWDGLTDDEKQCIYDLPNFDAAIFKECTGIDVGR